MIDLYTFTTPNGRKASVALEELELPYRAHSVNIAKGEQFKPGFLAINPNNKIPAIVDSDGPAGVPITLFESGAILIYLAEKTGKLLSAEPVRRLETLQWLMFQMGGVGPMFGQLNHFGHYAKEKVPYAIDRFTQESKRLMGVMDKALAEREYFAGEYSIADIALYPWVAAMRESFGELFEGRTHVQRWAEVLAQRPGVQRGMKVPLPAAS